MTNMGDQMDHDCKAAVKMKLIQLLKNSRKYYKKYQRLK